MQREHSCLDEVNKLDKEKETQTISWGWLEPSSVLLPYVSLRNRGVAIGRGKEAFEERVGRDDVSTLSLSNHILNGRSHEESFFKDLEFIEIADGRVSRMHCVIIQKENETLTESYVEDCSSNGTFLNGQKIKKGVSIHLNDQDKISLVQSVAPMTEHYFIFHQGSPQQKDDSKFVLSESSENERKEKLSRELSRSLTSTYTTAERSTLADFECQICLRVLSSCVTIVPCGHNFCASCLSQYLSNQLENGAQLVCPLRCPDPERIVKNETVRSLIASKRKETLNGRLSANDEEIQTIVEAEVSNFTCTCPLFDDQLPLDMKNLKSRQVEMAVNKISAQGGTAVEKNASLEAIVRLCWSDDTARKIVLDLSGVLTIKESMETYKDNESIQCNSCLALMSLVRGEGDICQTSQWHIARSGVVEVIGKAMRNFEKNQMVQLSAMLFFIPLALESPMMQAHLSDAVLSDILRALDIHANDSDLQCKGMIVVGILAQGDDALHDAIRIKQVELGVINRISHALETFGSDNEELFWGILFALATLARDKCPRFKHISRLLSRSGMLTLLSDVLNAYRQKMSVLCQEPDDTILSTANYLITVMNDAEGLLTKEWQYMLFGGLSMGLIIGTIVAFVALRRRSSF